MARFHPWSKTYTRQQLTLDKALRLAWITWFGLLAIPFVVFFAAIWRIGASQTPMPHSPLAESWFIATMVYLAVAVPSAFFWRTHFFRGYWAGHFVTPARYLIGMTIIWTSLAVGGLSAAIACLVTGTLIPNVVPALLALILFECFWPNGHSMTRPLHNEHDPATYEEPR